MSDIETLLLLALLCVFHPSPLCEAAVCYVKPTEPHNATCPSEPCHTLDEYVSNSTRYFVSNTVFMFLPGNHHLSNELDVSGVHNITLRPYIEKSDAVIGSELWQLLMFRLTFDIVIRDMTFQTLHIRFDNSTNVTLTGLTAKDAFIALHNVFGEVNIINTKMTANTHAYVITFTWTIAQYQYMPYTVVALHELELTGDSYDLGIYIKGCISGKMIILNSSLGLPTYMIPDISCKEMLFECVDTHFYNCTYAEAALYIALTSLPYENTMVIALRNVSFIDNPSAINVEYVHNITISDCYFGSSAGRGAIKATNSILSLTGNVTFRDNYNAYRGGALYLLGDSHILIPEPNNTYILFENNTAGDVGGAIYFSSSDPEVTGYCKMYVEQISNKIVFNFSMNSAVNGGNAIYGAYLEISPCYSPNGFLVYHNAQFILKVSSFSPSSANDSSVISSDARSVCFCDEDGKLGECSGPYHLSVYPGQVFRLSVAVLGDMRGLVKWPVYAAVQVNEGEFSKKTQLTQISSAERCTYFHYSILSNESLATLLFSLTGFEKLNYIAPYQVYFIKCPLGFMLSANNRCKCLQLSNMENITISCNITEQSIQRQGTTWIGVLEKNNTLAFSNVCPFLYCNNSSVKIIVNQTSFLHEDIQCGDNRSGVLCGGCRDGLSLALGSNRCLHDCSDSSIFLLIAFAAAGIALVFFIKSLNLTVSQGTINGLIFYANIVGVEQTILFSSKAYEGFLSVFIAWVNLDLGIETCFFDGMDAYTKAWLQFVFPVYVWAIALFIIILSHYSIRASKLFGNNSVPVLATLILLSYSKLLRAVISALSITDIQFLNGSTMSVWERDGNIQYRTGKHIPLFVFAVAVLILLWFPFTLILVSIQWLQRGTHYRVLHWVTKLRPFFEAFTGPLKDRHRYWVGALLLVRCSLLLVFYLYTANGSGVALFSISFTVLIILVFLAATGSLYRNYCLTILELSYILNLGIVAIGTLYVWYNSGNQKALVVTSVSIVFFQFMVTVIYHAYVQLREPLKKFQLIARVINQLEEQLKVGGQNNAGNIDYEEYEPLAEASFNVEPLQRPQFQEISDFREPLLGYLND